jgi:sec-independent protein translocase protein TatB
MFGIGTSEVLIILVVALVVIGPSKLPELARTLGKGLAEFRRVSSDVKNTIEMEGERLEEEEKKKKAKQELEAQKQKTDSGEESKEHSAEVDDLESETEEQAHAEETEVEEQNNHLAEDNEQSSTQASYEDKEDRGAGA